MESQLSDVEVESDAGPASKRMDDASNEACSFELGNLLPSFFGKKVVKHGANSGRHPPMGLNGPSRRLAMLEAWESAHWCSQDEKLRELQRRVSRIDASGAADGHRHSVRFAPSGRELDEGDGGLDHLPSGNRGTAFNPYQVMVQANRGSMTTRLDRSVWTAAFISPLVDTRPHLRLAAVIPQYAGLLLTVVAQVLFTMYIQGFVMKMRQRNKHRIKRCNPGSPILRFTCLCVLFASVATNEILEIVSFRRWLRAVPRWNEREHRRIAIENQTYLAMRKITALGGDSIFALATGITDRYRNFAYLGLVVVRLVVAIYMLIFGSGYIVYVERNVDIILNTLVTLL